MTARLTKQLAVRLDPELEQWLREISDEEGRTVAQSIRHILRIAMERGPYR